MLVYVFSSQDGNRLELCHLYTSIYLKTSGQKYPHRQWVVSRPLEFTCEVSNRTPWLLWALSWNHGIWADVFWFVFVDTLQGTNISHLGKRKIIFKMPFWGDMLVSWRVGGQTVGLRLRQLCGREVLPTFFFGTPKKSWQPLWKKKRFGQWWVPTNSFWIHVISSF